jgi:hypothetical protein
MIVARTDLITKLEERLAGRVSAAALAHWAFDLFYELEQGGAEVAPEDADAIAVVLDELLFADDERFALEPDELQRLIARLQQP